MGFQVMIFNLRIYISSNAATTSFKSGFIKHLGVAITTFALVGFLLDLEVQQLNYKSF